jgi:hypothetical protein
MNPFMFHRASEDVVDELLTMLLNDHIPVYENAKRKISGNTIPAFLSHRKQPLDEVLF